MPLSTFQSIEAEINRLKYLH